MIDIFNFYNGWLVWNSFFFQKQKSQLYYLVFILQLQPLHEQINSK